VQPFTVLLALDHSAVEEPIYQRGWSDVIKSNVDPDANVVFCEPELLVVLEKASRSKETLDAVIIHRDDNALPGSCTHLFDQIPNLAVVVLPRNKNCPPLYYRQSMCVEELENSNNAILAVLRCLRK
jgi:hypothetical protein